MINKKYLILFVLIIVLSFVFFLNSKESNGSVIIPIKVHIINEPQSVYSSSRTEEDIFELFNQANKIWLQADIYFQVEEIVVTRVSFEAIPNAINGNYQELIKNEDYDSDKINMYMTQSLNGINGIALYQINSALVSDFTTVNDYRTTAHELGHLFGLNHVNPSDRLMARGKNGEKLSIEEIEFTRKMALDYLEIIKQ